MNKLRMTDDIKKRRISPCFSNTYDAPCSESKGMSELLVAISTTISDNCCSEPKKYKNGIGKALFWSCKNCGADLGDVND